MIKILALLLFLISTPALAEEIKLTCVDLKSQRSTNYLIDVDRLSVKHLWNNAPWVKFNYVSDEHFGWLSETPSPPHIMMTIVMLDRFSLKMVSATISESSFDLDSLEQKQLQGVHGFEYQCKRGI